MDVTFLFWNIGGRPLQSRVAAIVENYRVDVLALAECADNDTEILTPLLTSGLPFRAHPTFLPAKVRLFSQLPENSVTEVFVRPAPPGQQGGRLVIWELRLPTVADFLIAGVHLSSKLYQESDDQSERARPIVRDVLLREQSAGHRRTLVFGDLNMNPFESGMVSASCFNAVMTRRLAARQHRVVEGEAHPYFYNPMWSFFGDWGPGPAGTYFYQKASPTNRFWNVLDQVLLRPDLADALAEVSVLTSDGLASLVSEDGLPEVSDHLPLLFRLHFED